MKERTKLLFIVLIFLACCYVPWASPTIRQSAKDVPQMVAIDGCSVGCAKAILEHSAVPMRRYLLVTDLGIEKDHNLNLERKISKR